MAVGVSLGVSRMRESTRIPVRSGTSPSTSPALISRIDPLGGSFLVVVIFSNDPLSFVPAPTETEFVYVACGPNRFVLQNLWLRCYLRARQALLKNRSLVQVLMALPSQTQPLRTTECHFGVPHSVEPTLLADLWSCTSSMHNLHCLCPRTHEPCRTLPA